MKENRCSHCQNTNKPQSNLTGMAGTDPFSLAMKGCWDHQEGYQDWQGTEYRCYKKNPSPVATIKT